MEKKDHTKKALEKMTAKELRAMAAELPDIVGAHGMNKEELLSAIRKAKGIKEPEKRKVGVSMKNLKKQIAELKKKREEATRQNDLKMKTICRKKISRLKKKTRKAA